jgi:hypothetical protein
MPGKGRNLVARERRRRLDHHHIAAFLSVTLVSFRIDIYLAKRWPKSILW